jgi:galactose oxidase
MLVRPGSVTHAFDMDQRVVGLVFKASDGMLTLSLPTPTIVPPGYYMLFVLNYLGVPSVASFVQVS